MKKVRKRILTEAVTGTYPVIPAKMLEKTMKEQIEPHLRKVGKAFNVEAADGHRISGMTFQAEQCRGTVMISHGFTEAWEKYMEMIYYFLQDGLNVCIHDHRGHGRSRDRKRIDLCKKVSEQERTVWDNEAGGQHNADLDHDVRNHKAGRKENSGENRNESRGENGGPTHIEHFQNYVDDWDAVVNQVMPSMPHPWYLFAHSMGGLIGATYIQQHPGTYEKAVFNAPMFEVNRGNLPYPVAKGAAFLLCLLGKGKEFLPGQSPFSEKEDFEGSASTCKERYLQHYHRQIASSHLQNGGSSCKWTLEAFRGDEKLLKKKQCRAMHLPILLFQAEKDDYVLPGGQDRFIASVPRGGILYVPGSKHEIYLSDDETMKRYVYAVMRFLR